MSRLHMSSFQSRLAAWLACVAMLMAALAPSVTRAIGTTDHPQALWTTICSASGTRMVQVDIGDADARHETASTSADCGYCLTHCALGLPPPAGTSVAPIAAASTAPAVPPRDDFHARFAWTISLSRGPPALS